MPAKLGLISLVVQDMAASLAFYRRLGLPIDERTTYGDESHVEVAVDGLFIAWDTEAMIRSFDPDRTFASGTGRVGLAFECAGRADVDALYNAMVGAGYAGHTAPFDAVWGQRYAVLLDPDGNPVDLYAGG